INCTASVGSELLPEYPRITEEAVRERYSEFEFRFRKFIRTVDQSIELRKDAESLFEALNRKLSSDGYLTSADQQAIQQDLAQYRENRDSLKRLVENFSFYSDKNTEVLFPADLPSSDLVQNSSQYQSSTRILRINPEDDLGRLMILEAKLWLASKLIVYDNYVVVLVRYLKNSSSRRQFNLEAIDPKGKQFLEEIVSEITDDEKFESTVRSIALVEKTLDYETDNPTSKLAKDKDDSYLDTVIRGSYAYHRIPELGYLDKIRIGQDSFENAFYDSIVNLSEQTTDKLSELFGNTIGLYEKRKGKLFHMPQSAQSKITDSLQILDILFEKTPFRLTDLFIPGHWGHVAIWIGGKTDISELKRLGVWQKLPEIETQARAEYGYKGPSFQSLIESNHSILEALRHGVELNTFSDFLNIDDLAVVRINNLTDKQKKDYLIRAFSQIGKGYDFNFDIESSGEIVCSELIFVVYDDYDWPVEKSLGRYTVSPDHVAKLALTDSEQFFPFLMFHDGKELPLHHNQHNFKLLLEEDYENVLFK
ncbi:MAG: YiiX/YebB-like N1pC/P60 family cysteine hydrolase, partial [Desulfobulbia bacterium]